jgi:hypothetical protein
LYLSGMRVRVRFYSGRYGEGIIRDRLLHIDGYTFTRGMVTALGWEVCVIENDLLPLHRSIGHNADDMTEFNDKLPKEIPARGN